MKKIFLLFLVAVLSCPAMPVQARPVSKTPGYDVGVGPIITITVEFGRRKKGCKGLGICDVTVDWGDPEPMVGPSGSGKAWMENGKLHMELNRSSIEPGTFSTYFGSGVFTLEEEFTLSEGVASALGIAGYTVKAGNYTVTSESGSSTLSLTF